MYFRYKLVFILVILLLLAACNRNSIQLGEANQTIFVANTPTVFQVPIYASQENSPINIVWEQTAGDPVSFREERQGKLARLILEPIEVTTQQQLEFRLTVSSDGQKVSESFTIFLLNSQQLRTLPEGSFDYPRYTTAQLPSYRG